MDEESNLKKRFLELADRAYNGNRYYFTNFLSMSEISLLHSLGSQIGNKNYMLFGGMEDCERCVARFGNKEEIGFEEDFPIHCVKIEPLMQKYADTFTHRDILGSVMGLGIERSNIGDIIISGNCGFLFCLERMSGYIIDSLGQVKHTHVKCALTDQIPEHALQGQEMSVQVHTERIDALISKLYALSRSASIELFRGKKVFVNARQCENNSYQLKVGDIVSVRGYGRFRFEGVLKTTRKGNLNVRIVRY